MYTWICSEYLIKLNLAQHLHEVINIKEKAFKDLQNKLMETEVKLHQQEGSLHQLGQDLHIVSSELQGRVNQVL